MSYCRVGIDSDVYVFRDDRGLCCCGCIMVGTSVFIPSFEALKEHLYSHRAVGHKVPEKAFDYIYRDEAEEARG